MTDRPMTTALRLAVIDAARNNARLARDLRADFPDSRASFLENLGDEIMELCAVDRPEDVPEAVRALARAVFDEAMG